MAKSKSKNKFIPLMLITLVSVGILVFKAYVRLPISNDGVTGRNLYPFLNNTQFIETAIVTFIGVGLFSQMVIKTSVFTAWLLAFGFTAVNLGIMIIDARAQKYNVFVEQYIKQTYGNMLWIYFLAIIALACGIFSINYASKKL